MFFTLFGDWLCVLGGGGGQWSGTQPAYAVFRHVQLKIEVSATYFFDFVTIHNDQPSYVKHVLGSIPVFFTLFGDRVCVQGSTKRANGNLVPKRVFLPVLLQRVSNDLKSTNQIHPPATYLSAVSGDG